MSNNLFFALSTARVNALEHERRPSIRITFDDLREYIQGKKITIPAEYNELPDLARRAYCDSDKDAADDLSNKKKALPYVLFSGFCPIHHDNATLEYNGALQVDFDFKTADGQRLTLDVLQRIRELRPAGVLLAVPSPSTFGVKILLQTDNQDKDRHREALDAAVAYLAELLDLDPKHADGLGASQPCYIPFERTPGQAYFNPDADVLPITFSERNTDDQVERSAVVYSDDLVAAAAQYLTDQKIDVATCYDEYFQICCACKNAFGDQSGKQIAWHILENSAAFSVSDYRKKFGAHWRSIKRSGGRIVTGATLVHLAGKNGFCGLSERPGRTFDAKPGEYLTDVLDRHQIDLDDVCGKYIVSPTGSGKTTFVAEYLRRGSDRRVVLVVPTLALVNRICKRHQADGAVRFVGRSRNITPDDRFVVTTPNSFPALATRVNLRLFDVFLDEAHGLTSDTSRTFKLDVLRKFYSTAKLLAKSGTYLTGTALYNSHPEFEQVERWTIRADRKIEKTAYLYQAEQVLAAAVAGIRQSIERGRFPVLLLNDKYLKLAEVETTLQDLKLAVLNSEKKEDALFKQITSSGIIPDDVQAIVTTTVFKEGNDLDDKRGFDFFVVGQHHSSTIEQLSARARTASDVSVYVIKGKDRKTHDRTFNPYRYAKKVEQNAQRFCDEQNNQDGSDDTAALFFERQIRQAIQYAPVHQDDDGKLQVCYFAVNNEVYQAETQVEYANDTYLARNLRRYGFDIVGENRQAVIQVTHDATAVQEIKQAKKVCKAEREAAHQAALDTLQAAISPAVVIQHAERDRTAPKAYKWLKRLVDKYGVEVRQGIELLREVDTGKKFTLLENRIRIHLMRTNQTYLDSGRIWSIILRKVAEDLRPGKQAYTAEDLREKLVQTLALDKSIDLRFLEPEPDDQDAIVKANRRAIAILRMFFDVQEVGRLTRRTCPRKRVFSLNKITQFHGHVFGPKRTSSTSYDETTAKRLERDFCAAVISLETP